MIDLNQYAQFNLVTQFFVSIVVGMLVIWEVVKFLRDRQKTADKNVDAETKRAGGLVEAIQALAQSNVEASVNTAAILHEIKDVNQGSLTMLASLNENLNTAMDRQTKMYGDISEETAVIASLTKDIGELKTLLEEYKVPDDLKAVPAKLDKLIEDLNAFITKYEEEHRVPPSSGV